MTEPSTPEEMTENLVNYYGRPCVLREEGVDTIVCPYCNEQHSHPGAHGHHRAGCADSDSDITLAIGERVFIPAYGYDIYEYKKVDQGYEIRALN